MEYYAISLAKKPGDEANLDPNDRVFSSKRDALANLKKWKDLNPRVKVFSSQIEALNCAENISEHTADAAKPAISGEGCAAKSLTPQELKLLKEAILRDDEPKIRELVASNPRYLMTPCDQPSIIHSGTRANALHIAAKAGLLNMVELILELVSDPDLLKRMYPNESPENRAQRQEYLLDLYLNMPKKGDFDTPLHQAAKWGHWRVIEFLAHLSSCDTKRKNNEGLTAVEVACSRMDQPDADVKKKITDILADRVYIPVYRADDQSIPGFIGPPISPAASEQNSSSSPLRSNLRLPMPAFNPLWSPLSPRTKSPLRTFGDSPLVRSLDFDSFEKNPLKSPVSVKALMGPLSPNDAERVKSEWKRNSPLRLADPEKGLEKQGRQLAQKFNTKLVEYWPFLDTYCDIKSDTGLQLLENHLQDQSQKSAINYHDDSLSEIANTLAKMNLNSSSNGSFRENDNARKDENSNQEELGVMGLLSEQMKVPFIRAFNANNEAFSPLSHSAVWSQARDAVINDSSMLSNENQVSFEDRRRVLDRSLSTSSDESYVSALSSLHDDDDSIYSAEEGSWIYVEGDRPGKADAQVYEALADCDVDAKRFPGVYTWKCLVQSVSPLERKQWSCEKPIKKLAKVPPISFDESMTN